MLKKNIGVWLGLVLLTGNPLNFSSASASEPSKDQPLKKSASKENSQVIEVAQLPVVKLTRDIRKSSFVLTNEKEKNFSYAPSTKLTDEMRQQILAHPDRVFSVAKTANIFLDSDLVYVHSEAVSKEAVARAFVSFLDSSYAFLSEKEVADLSSNPTLDLAIEGKSFQWAHDVVRIVSDKMQAAAQLKSCSAQFSSTDQKFNIPTKWLQIAPIQKYMTWQCMQMMSDKKTDNETTEALVKIFLLNAATKMNGMSSDRIAELFIKAHAYAVDPHSMYLTASEKRMFKYQLNKTTSGFGVSWKIDEAGTVRFASLPDLQDQATFIEENAELISIKIKEIPVFFKGKKDEEISALFDQAGQTAIITFKKGDILRTVEIPKRKIGLKNSIVSSKKIIYENKKILLIKIPLFYQDENAEKTSRIGGSASLDLARQLEENASEYDMLVLDLRGNGGGLLNEAVNMLSLFVDGGAAVQLRTARNQDVKVLKIPKGKVQWKGPLVLLVNRSSASASEIFASAIQDNARGLIVGQKTFGKGTVQNTFDLDELAGTEDSFGQINLTTMVFFRPSGIPLQLNGVVPDISFVPPSLKTGEAAMANAIVNTVEVDDLSLTSRSWVKNLNKTEISLEADIALNSWYPVWSKNLSDPPPEFVFLNKNFFDNKKKQQESDREVIKNINNTSLNFKNDPMLEYATKSGLVFYSQSLNGKKQ